MLHFQTLEIPSCYSALSVPESERLESEPSSRAKLLIACELNEVVDDHLCSELCGPLRGADV